MISDPAARFGATFDADGAVRFAVWSHHAARVTLALFDETRTEFAQVPLERDGDVHRARVEDLEPGMRYGLRAEGPFDPARGFFFNRAKLLLDPYATEIDRPFRFLPSLVAQGDARGFPSPIDSAPDVPCAVLRHPPAPPRTARPRVPPSRRVIYEVPVRAFTRRHPDVPPARRGTIGALAEPAVLDHLKTLGVTTLELMPITAWIGERHLVPLGLTNAWGYAPISYFAPDPRLAPGGLAEVRDTVDALHDAGIEVVLDVVFNHTGESDAAGPSLSLRGLDGASYFRHGADGSLVNDTGCGNTLACDREPVARLVLDSLRHWASVAGVDGFRFDLATTLGRRAEGFDPDHPLLKAITTDAALADLILIAEPWDVGPGGYRLGGFRAPWQEWNDRYRNDVRRFWRGEAHALGALATRLAGSSDVFQGSGRGPGASVNFVACHDGFTLADLVTYERKHNLANGEDNRDGTDDNHSWNHGVEGPSDDDAIVAKRKRDIRALLATLFVSRGTPMLTAGDELGRTQLGNNNAYAQDNATSWLDWVGADHELSAFCARLIAARAAHPALREDRFLDGRRHGTREPDVLWLSPSGLSLTTAEWDQPENRVLGMVLTVPAGEEPADRVAIFLNAGTIDCAIALPDVEDGEVWSEVFDTAAPQRAPATFHGLAATSVAARSVRLLAVTKDAVASAGKRDGARTGVDPNVLHVLAEAAGVERSWWDLNGVCHHTSPETLRTILSGMGFAVGSTAQAREALGELQARRHAAATEKAPPCFQPPALADNQRRFGLAAHLYALRHDGDAGIGDFETLARFSESAGRMGAALVGVNPFHALFPTDRARASPYHPCDRRFLDPIYIDVAALPALLGSEPVRDACEAQAGAIAALARRDAVDYAEVAAVKESVLRAAFAAFETAAEAGTLPEPLVAEHRAFLTTGGEALAGFALFDVLAKRAGTTARTRWLTTLDSFAGRGVAAARREFAREIRYVQFQQWLADRGLAAAAARGASAGLSIGLYRDLAVGAAPDGAETWISPGDFVAGVSVGAPPDPFSADGQVWCVPPLDPLKLEETDCAAFRALVAANMRHAGALRIDHAMSLMRLFFVPDGAKAVEGTYVRYPFEAMLGVLAEESRKARCLIVGEDLGTVPWGFRERATEAGIFGMRILLFERDGLNFRRPTDYAYASVASFGSHDLPTFAGWVAGRDIEIDHALGRIDESGVAQHRAERRADIGRLATMMADAGWPAAPDWFAAETLPPSLIGALHGALGTAGSALVMVQADDIAGERDALNVPGTNQERPNWRRRLRCSVADLAESPAMRATLEALATRYAP